VRDPNKVMNVGLDCRIGGQPGRAGKTGSTRFIAYAKSQHNVWFAGRSDVGADLAGLEPGSRPSLPEPQAGLRPPACLEAGRLA